MATSRGRTALVGAVTALAAIAAGELLAGLVSALPSLLDSVAGLVVDGAPPELKDAAVGVLGTADKPALLIGTVTLAAAAGAALGASGRRSVVAAGVALFGLVGFLAAARGAGMVAAFVASALAAAAGLAVLRLLPSGAPAIPVGEATAQPSKTRRHFVRALTGTAALAVVGGFSGRLLNLGAEVEEARAAVVLPRPASPLTPPAPTTSVPVAGISPLITPNNEFYRIDTALTVPRIDPETWTLRVTGLVDRPVEITYAELLDMPLEEADVTLACVSNEVGGALVGNARWLGVPLDTLLERAGVQPGAEQVVGRSVDGFTAGFPLAALDEGDRKALVAVGMNGEPLPARHGFPARLVVAGLYGYVSATKWLSEIELTTWDFDAYWVPRGWAKEAPIKTQSRIDVPRPGARVAPGRVAIAGVAWAPTRGIAVVEVRVDQGPWRAARLADSLADDTWRQWVFEWDARPGEHMVEVRATDGTGSVQTDEQQPPRPDGATGWHRVHVEVEQP